MTFCSCPYGNPSSQKLFREKRKCSSKFRELCYRGEEKPGEKREERQIGRNMWEEKRTKGVIVSVWEERKSKGKRRSERAIRVMCRASSTCDTLIPMN